MIATRFLPPLAVIAAMAVPALLLRPAHVVVDEPAEVLVDEHSRAFTHGGGYVARDMTVREHQVEGCFLEWDERAGGDTEMTVRVDIDTEGLVLVTSKGGPDHPSLRMCVEEAFLRTQYPIGHTLSFHLTVEWRANRLQISPDLIEPYTGTPHHVAKRQLEELKRERARLEREVAKHRARHH